MTRRALTIFAAGLMAASVSAQDIISFNFADGYQLVSNQTAGAAPYNAAYWNNLLTDWSGNSGAVPNPLRYNNGTAVSGLTLVYDGPNTWRNNITSNSGDTALMKGYMDSNNGDSPYFKLNGIPFPKYDVVLYVDGDNTGGGTDGPYLIRAGQNTTVQGASSEAGINLTYAITPAIYLKEGVNFNGGYTNVPLTSTTVAGAVTGNYIVFTNIAGRIVIDPTQCNSPQTRAPLNGVQIVRNTDWLLDVNGGTVGSSSWVSPNTVQTVSGSKTIGSLYTSRNFYIAPSDTLTLNQGDLEMGLANHWITASATGGPGGKITSSTGTLTLRQQDPELTDLRIQAVLADDGVNPVRIVKEGYGVLVLDAENTFSGGTLISRGSLQVGAGGTTGTLGGGDVTNNAALIVNRSDAIAVSNLISGTGTLTKNGAGKLTLTGANSYSGLTTVNGGTLAVGTDTAAGSGALDLKAGSTLQSADASDRTLANRLIVSGNATLGGSGTGNLNFNGVADNGAAAKTLTIDSITATFNGSITNTGAVALQGSGTFKLGAGADLPNSGGITVGAGTVFDATAPGFTNRAGKTFGGVGSVTGPFVAQGTINPGMSPGTLTYSNNLELAAATLNFELSNVGTVGGGVNDLIDVLGSLAATNGVTTVNVLPYAGALASSYTLIAYAGALDGTEANFTVGNAGLFRQTMAVRTNTANAITLDVGGAVGSLTWNGNGNSTWDITNSPSWDAGVFYQLDTVNFTDAGAASNAVTIAGTLLPGSVTVNSASNYTFGGAGKIGGGTGLTKQGNGILTVGTANDYTGVTTIEGGTLKIGNNAALGSTNAGTVVQGGGTLDFNGNTDIGLESLTVSGAGVGGAGALVNNGAAGGINQAEKVILAGDATFGGSQRWDIRDDGPVTGDASLTGAYKLSKVGAGTISLVGATINVGDIEINEGVFSIETASTINPGNTITVNTNGALQMWQTAAAIGRDITVNNGRIVGSSGSGTQNTLSGAMTVNGSVTNQADAQIIQSGVVQGGGGLVKTGGSVLYLTADNTYAGGTLVSAGTLQVGNGGTTGTLGTGAVTNNGTLRFERTDAITIANPIVGSGSVAHYGPGTVRFNDILQTGSLFMGNNAVGSSVLVVSNGDSVSFGNAYIGEATGRSGTILQFGGLFDVTGVQSGNDGNFRLGHYSTQTSTYFLDGGTLQVTNTAGRLSLGIDGTGVLNINGGTAIVTRVDVNGRSDGATDGGELRLSNGVLRVAAGGIQTLGTPYTVVFAGGRLEAAATFTAPVNATLANTNQGFVVDTAGNTITMGGLLSGAGGIVKEGAGTLDLSNASTSNSFAGGVVVNAGTLKTSGSYGSSRVPVGTTLTVNPGATLHVAGINSLNSGNASPLVNVFGGTLTFEGTHQHIQNVVFSNATINTIGAGKYNGEDVQLDGGFTVIGGLTTATFGEGLAFNGVRPIDVQGGAAMVIDGEVENNDGGAAGLVKLGAGRLTLNGAVTYAGSTTVSNGLLEINGAYSGGAISVAGGTLGGTGSVSSVTVGSGATLAPGNSPGTMTFSGGLVLDSGAILSYELDAPNYATGASGSDFITGVTDLTLDGILDVVALGGFAPTNGAQWKLIGYSGTLTDNGLQLGSAPTLAGGLSYGIETDSSGVYLNVIPEPATVGLLGLALAAAVLRRRRG